MALYPPSSEAGTCLSEEGENMVRPDFAKWGQDAETIRHLALTAEHPRTRERFLALYMIGTGRMNASQWFQEIGSQPHTVRGWVHRYNAEGPASLYYRRTGDRRPPFCPEEEEEQIVRAVRESAPIDHGLPGHGWTLKKLRAWVAAQLGRTVSQSLDELFLACLRFIETINQDPETVLRRLGPKVDLDPEFEKLLFSN